jgi:gliding motility associated protien GldN
MNDGDDDATRTDDRRSLIDVIYSAVAEGTITAYDAKGGLDDEFRESISEAEIIIESGAGQEINTRYDQDLIAQGVDPELAEYQDTVNNPFDRNIIKKWRLKEEWFFDKQRSVMDVRIIGMAPLKEDKDDEGRLSGTFSPLFWVWFPEARKVLIKAEVFNLVKNDAERRTYDDIFWKRMFGSVIVREANVMDREVNEYMVGLDALLEAERIKAEIFNIEHDLWEY